MDGQRTRMRKRTNEREGEKRIEHERNKNEKGRFETDTEGRSLNGIHRTKQDTITETMNFNTPTIKSY